MYQISIYAFLFVLHGATIGWLGPVFGYPSGPTASQQSTSILSVVGTIRIDALETHKTHAVTLSFQPASEAVFDIYLWDRPQQFQEHAPLTDTHSPDDAMLYVTDSVTPLAYQLNTVIDESVFSPQTIQASANPADSSHEQCGWADGTDCTIVPIPWLRWIADERTQFSIGISHQQLGDETDLGVIGMLSMEF